MFCKYMRAAAIAALPFGVSAAADELRYEAVWHQDLAPGLTTAPLSLENFLNSGQDLAEAGLRLIDVETAMVDGARRYAGFWTEGAGTNLFVGPIGAIDFGNERREKFEQGLRLTDFEVFRTATGGRRYLGVWRPGRGEERITGPMQQAAFFARGENFAEQGLRLRDVEVEVVNGTLLYHGVFGTGTGSNLITAPQSRPAFVQTRDDMVARGLELIDVEHVEIGGQDRYVGVWASGEGESRLSMLRPFGAYFIFTQGQFNDDKGTRDFELRRVVERPGTPDPDPGDPTPGGTGTTADLPALPDWIDITGPFGNPRVVMDFIGPFTDPGFRLTIHSSLLPANLPRNADGDPVIPDNFCGLRMVQPSASLWETPGGTIDTNEPYLHHPNFLGEPLATQAMQGIDFTGPMGACAEANEPWQFMNPLTTDSTGGPPPPRRLVVEFPDAVEFLNFNIHAGEPLDVDELFSDDVFETLVEIAEVFNETGADNGYCEGVSGYMVELCDANPGLCPVADPEAGC